MNGDILVLEENKNGIDYIIGDVHGNFELLKAVCAKLGQDDRLFIVGDVIDRGVDSFAVCKFLQAHKDKIFVSRGNHEEMFLEFMNNFANSEGLQKFLDFLKKALEECFDLSNAKEAEDILNDDFSKAEDGNVRKNFLTWMRQSYDEQYKKCASEIDKKMIDKFRKEYMLACLRAGLNEAMRENEIVRSCTSLCQCIDNGGKWIVGILQKDDGFNDLLNLKKQFQELPYIIHVNGEKPFNVVHADMPINDAELQLLIDNNVQLTAGQKFYAIWASAQPERKCLLQSCSRNNKSDFTYCGHTIFGEVRKDTNTVNLDVGSYDTYMALLFNHKSKSCELIKISKNIQYALKVGALAMHQAIANYLENSSGITFGAEQNLINNNEDRHVSSTRDILQEILLSQRDVTGDNSLDKGNEEEMVYIYGLQEGDTTFSPHIVLGNDTCPQSVDKDQEGKGSPISSCS